jgi:hypothetical protein
MSMAVVMVGRLTEVTSYNSAGGVSRVVAELLRLTRLRLSRKARPKKKR